MDHIQFYSDYKDWLYHDLSYGESLYKRRRWEYNSELGEACRKAVYEPRRIKRLEEWM